MGMSKGIQSKMPVVVCFRRRNENKKKKKARLVPGEKPSQLLSQMQKFYTGASYPLAEVIGRQVGEWEAQVTHCFYTCVTALLLPLSHNEIF